MLLQDRVIIVTGASSGLGRTYATRLAREGAKLTLADVADLSKTTLLCAEAGVWRCCRLRVDVSSEEDTLAMAQQTHERFGRIDGLLNNAGITTRHGLEAKSLMDIDMGMWDRVFAVNTRGTFLGIRAVYPYMREQGSGTIVNVSSGSTLRISPRGRRYECAVRGVQDGDHGHHAGRGAGTRAVQHQRRDRRAGVDDLGHGGAAVGGRGVPGAGGVDAASRRAGRSRGSDGVPVHGRRAVHLPAR